MIKILVFGSILPLAAFGVAGCLVSGGNVDKSAGALETDAGSSAPIPLSSPTCDPSNLFGPPVLVPGFGGHEIISGRISPDELSAVLSVKNGANGYDFFTASRTTTSDPFVLGAELSELNTPLDEYWPTLSADGLTIHFESARAMSLDDGGVAPAGVPRIWEATRPDLGSPFGTPIVPGFFRVVQPEAAPSLAPDGRSIYFSSLARGTTVGALDLYVADVSAYGVITGFASLPSGPHDDNMPLVTADRRTLLFGRDDPSTRYDIWAMGRQDDFPTYGTLSQQPTPAPQDIPQELTELNSVYDDFPMSVSTDACRLYFISDRPVSGVSQYRIWMAAKP